MGKLPIPFNNPRTYPGHSGIDFGQPLGTPFRASGPGRVTSRGNNKAGGFYIWVQYNNGPRVGYHHMDSFKGCPTVGTRVVEGTQLGLVGNTGNSTGPHLHSEVSGHRTTAGYWKFFDSGRVVGSSGGNTAKPSGSATPTTPATIHQEDLMRFLFCRDRGGAGKLWTIINTATGKVKQTRSQSEANLWAESFGPAEVVSVSAYDAARKVVEDTI